MKVLVRVLTVLFFLLLAGAAAGVIVYFSLQAGGVSFYIEQGDERYYSGTGGKELFLQRGDTYEFSIKSLTGENVDYSVRVLSNAENSFSFVFNDELWRLYDTDDGKNDYTALFDVSEQNDMFTVTIPDELTVKKAVEQQFGGEITPQSEIQGGVCYFVLIVSVGDHSLSLPFCFEPSVSIGLPSVVF